LTGYVLSPAAESDVNVIWDYTTEKWGARQAVSYISDIRDACDALAQGRQPRRSVSVRDGYFKAMVGLHMIYFRESDDGLIVVIRILHQSMDVGRHLPE
jgi:toxin ParE1/3/4